MDVTNCSICQKPKAPYNCGVCDCTLCKKCARFLDEEQFSFFRVIPEILTKSIYCNSCYSERVEPQVARYEEIMTRAKDVFVFLSDQGKESRLFSRLEPPITIEDCPDRNETVLRLAFYAAQAGFNGLLDVKLSSEKVRNGSFKKLKWKGVAIPTHIDGQKLTLKEAQQLQSQRYK
jgi:hypothetical protein